MRLAQAAYKFEGLHLGHQFFYDLLNLFGALGLNVAKEKIKKIPRSQCKRIQNLTCQNDLYDIFYFIYSKIFY